MCLNGNSIAQSKRNQNPWVDISQLNAIVVSSNMKTSINSHLIYGIEWDSILQWLLDNGAKIGCETKGQIKTIALSDIQTDSRSWGNYSNSTGDAEINCGSLQKSGINENWKCKFCRRKFESQF